LFVGDLSREATEVDIHNLFSQHGTVSEIIIKKHKLNGLPLGFGFIRMSTATEAGAALAALDGSLFLARRLRVGWARRSTVAIFISNLCPSVTVDDLEEAFSKYGELETLKTRIHTLPIANTASVAFLLRDCAGNAVRRMNGETLGTMELCVDFAHPHPGRVSYRTNTPAFRKPMVDHEIVSLYVCFKACEPDQQVSETLLTYIFETVSSDVASVHIKSTTVVEGLVQGYAFVHYAPTDAGRANAMVACRAASDVILGGLHITTEVNKNFCRSIQHSYTHSQAQKLHPTTANANTNAEANAEAATVEGQEPPVDEASCTFIRAISPLLQYAS
jgi:RNA recognition motif-containing protein